MAEDNFEIINTSSVHRRDERGVQDPFGGPRRSRRRKPPFLVRWAVVAVSLWVAVQLIDGIRVDGGLFTYALIALVFGFVNAVVGTVLKVLVFPLVLVTLGLFVFVINALMLELTDALITSFSVDGFGAALGGALIISLTTMVLNMAVKRI